MYAEYDYQNTHYHCFWDRGNWLSSLQKILCLRSLQHIYGNFHNQKNSSSVYCCWWRSKRLHYVMDFTQNTTKMRQAGTWDPLLQGLHRDTPLLQQWNTKKLQGTKTNYVHVQFGQTMDKRYKQTKKGQLPLLKSWEQKQYIVHAPCIQCHQRSGQNT